MGGARSAVHVYLAWVVGVGGLLPGPGPRLGVGHPGRVLPPPARPRGQPSAHVAALHAAERREARSTHRCQQIRGRGKPNLLTLGHACLGENFRSKSRAITLIV